MLPLDKYIPLVKEWAKTNQWGLMRKSAAKRLEAKEIIDLGLGSYYRFIHEEWFEKLKKEGLVYENELGQWIPIVEITEDREVIGLKGKTPIYSKKKSPTKISQDSLDKLSDFDKRYNAWIYGQQQKEIDFSRIIKSYTGGL